MSNNNIFNDPEPLEFEQAAKEQGVAPKVLKPDEEADVPDDISALFNNLMRTFVIDATTDVDALVAEQAAEGFRPASTSNIRGKIRVTFVPVDAFKTSMEGNAFISKDDAEYVKKHNIVKL